MSTKLSWTSQAVEDLAHIRRYIAEDSPKAATRVVATIVALAERQLSNFPRSGRIGRVEGTFELVVPKTPFIIAYDLTSDAVRVLAVHHASRRWPEAF
jgi:toxin ParE1/3/4